MRLSKIKLAGFKSFVEPTTIEFPSNLVGVVGPNGCGKSNVIDAVRWVMGESSPSRLRGDSMTDVIFNGSSARKPVGTASIELLFDNSDAKVGGQYASFSEIAIRRTVSRDGLSTYFLNGAKCRRKDITQIFLGTGLGPRSYSIIEQGMISRLIEAKPEDMRVFLEEAAGISKYKERRRETENRIKHTRENLERLTDLLEEVESQLKRLDRQAKTAERYKRHKATERRLVAELLGLRLIELDTIAERNERLLAERENALQAAIADQRRAEAAIEEAREQLTERNDTFNDVQGRFYRIGAEIARLEQSIEHSQELRRRQQQDLAQAEAGAREILEHIEKDSSELEQLQLSLSELAPGLEQAKEREQLSGESLARAEAAMQEWQDDWDTFNRSAGEAERLVQVENTRIEQLQAQLQRLAGQREAVQQRNAALPLDDLRARRDATRTEAVSAAEAAEAADRQLADSDREIASRREQLEQLEGEVDTRRLSLQKMQGRYASLEALQKAALGEGDGAVSRWLESHSLQESARLAQRLDVESGWERAVETVLGSYLQAVCVDSIDDAVRSLSGLGEGALMLMETGGTGAAADAGRLTAKVRQAPAGVSVLLSRVFAADSLADALAVRSRLADDESVVTRDGIWLGRHWVRVNRGGDAEAGVLQREQDMRSLRRRIRDEEGLAEQAGGQLAQLRNETRELEQRRGALREASVQRNRQAAETAAAVENAAARLSEAEERRVANERSLRELDEERAAAQTKITASRQAIEASAARIAAVASDRERLERQRIELREELDRVRTQAAEDRAAARDIAIRFESRRSSQESARQSLARMERQLEQFREREQALNAQMAQADEPIAEQQAALAERLEERVEVERSLGEARHRVENTEAQLREHELARGEHEESVDAARTALDDVRMAGQETRVRRETLTEQFNETGFELATIRAEMPEDAGAEAWSEKLENLQAKIERLGPINLAAIEEFKEQAERKDYLDSQLTDLRSALDTLENAIRKIDRETRTRFKETYDRVNTGFQTLFPRLFGGGHAYLELTGDDLLAAGVTVMARPPGKRNSTIHLLSGGEKALTAVALVFAIFELNPAPFCMLDEVDAPLDDANVARFCDIVKSMSETVQFVFISHNKVTMEMARQLMGVTMYEPGVSRLVAVDLDEAVKMAAS